jgi:predicted kinase
MEAIIFTGLQGAGKSTFYREHFFATHVRVSLDMLRTRHREAELLRACLEMKQAFVVDNTNPTVAERAQYIAVARAARFRVVGYYFDVPLAACLARNAARPERERIPALGLHATRKRLQPPTLAEGFGALYRVFLDADGSFLVEAVDDVS